MLIQGTTMYDEEGNEVLLVQTVTFGKTTAIDNTRDDLYLGTWIAETTIIHPNSDLIKQHQKQTKIGKYSQSEERACIAYMESTVVDISITPSSIKLVSLYLRCS